MKMNVFRTVGIWSRAAEDAEVDLENTGVCQLWRDWMDEVREHPHGQPDQEDEWISHHAKPPPIVVLRDSPDREGTILSIDAQLSIRELVEPSPTGADARKLGRARSVFPSVRWRGAYARYVVVSPRKQAEKNKSGLYAKARRGNVLALGWASAYLRSPVGRRCRHSRTLRPLEHRRRISSVPRRKRTSALAPMNRLNLFFSARLSASSSRRERPTAWIEGKSGPAPRRVTAPIRRRAFSGSPAR